jgi:hypothetical protein
VGSGKEYGGEGGGGGLQSKLKKLSIIIYLSIANLAGEVREVNIRPLLHSPHTYTLRYRSTVSKVPITASTRLHIVTL